MRYSISALLIACLLGGALAGCDLFSGTSDSGTVTLTGLVINLVTGDPVPGAFVRVTPSDQKIPDETDSEGRYRIEVKIDSTMELTVTVSKSGYLDKTTTVLAVADRTIDVASIQLVPTDGTASDISGLASNLLLLSQSATSIGVRESGSQEVAELVFQATDSLGRPVNLTNQATVRFSFGANPGGGAFIYPESAVTNENGEVRTNISSGTIAGVIQVIAEATVRGRTIRSKPVALAVHGGLPDADHFGVTTRKLNVARAWDIWGVETGVIAFVGDRFGNPVRPETVVYFTTTAGLIGGSGTTDASGRATVTLLSGPPQPAHPQYGPGYVTITGSTGDEGGSADTPIVNAKPATVLFSGTTQIVVPTGQGPILKGEAYEFYVYDQNQNPLAEGTTITVIANGTNVEAFGNTDVLFSDNLFGDHNDAGQCTNYGITCFSFGYQQGGQQNEQGVVVPDELEAITIRVQSPNGNAERVVLQSGVVLKRDDAGKLIPVID